MINVLSNLSLKTKLLVMMVSLCFLSIGFLFYLYARAERELLDEVKHHTEELSTAIQVSIEQISKTDNSHGHIDLKKVMKLNKKGIKEISVINSSRDVIASSNPELIGKKLHLKGESVKHFGNVTEYTTTTNGHKRYDILLPVVLGKDRLGYIHLETQFEDFANTARENHRNRLLSTLIVFLIGMLGAMYLSKRYTQPIKSVADAAHKVSGGDLSVRLSVEGNDEIGKLARNFNEMVERLEENRELQARLREAEHMSKIGALASGIAHEVRNPLNLINLSIDHMRSAYPPEDPARREAFNATVATVKSEIERLNSMVSNFLNFGKPLSLSLKAMDMEPVLEETIALMQETCRESNVIVEASFSESRRPVMADYKQIKACFLNLFINAIQAMPDGGRLSVGTSVSGAFVTVRISDTGHGIAPESINRIFDPYFTTKDIGIGLGLALTKRIIEEHGGRISVSSVVDRGTAVNVNLPVTAVA